VRCPSSTAPALHPRAQCTAVDERQAALLVEIKHAVDDAKAHRQVLLPTDQQMACFRRRLRVLKQGLAHNSTPSPPEPGSRKRGRKPQSPAGNQPDRLAVHPADMLAFMCNWTVPFDNTQAERDLRMMKVAQKVSGCFRLQAGAHAFCHLCSCRSTARKHRQPGLGSSHLAMFGPLFTPSCIAAHAAPVA